MNRIEWMQDRLRRSDKFEHFLETVIPKSVQPQIAKSWETKVVVFHVGRSGSTVLGDLMEQNPKVFWACEVYHRLFGRSWKKDVGGFTFDAKQSLVSRLFLERLFDSEGKTVYGFEVKPFHLEMANISFEDYLDFLQNTVGVKHFVVLKRNNYLRKIISSQIGSMKAKFHEISGEGDRKPSITEVQLNVNAHVRAGESAEAKPLIEHFRYFDRCFERLEKLLENRQTLNLTYEEHIQSDPQVAAKLLSEFIGLEYQPGKIHHRKTNPYPIEEMVTNYDELKAYLSGTEYEWMLYQ